MKILMIFIVFGTIPIHSALKISPNYDFPEEGIKIFEIGCVLTLVCTITEGHDNTLRWFKYLDGSKLMHIEGDHHYELKQETLRIENPVSGDAGDYLCVLESGLNATITVIANVKASLNEEYYFVEGETLNVTCAVDGTDPYVRWRIGNETFGESRDNVEIERGIKYGRLMISDVKTNDTNTYTCIVENRATKLLGIGKEVSTQIHIWQKYVILWPYIGVCFEVGILCVAILFYEKRCTKPEMELDDIEELDEDEEMEGDMNYYNYDASSNTVSAVDLRQRK